jgi:hypothetical protein
MKTIKLYRLDPDYVMAEDENGPWMRAADIRIVVRDLTAEIERLRTALAESVDMVDGEYERGYDDGIKTAEDDAAALTVTVSAKDQDE